MVTQANNKKRFKPEKQQSALLEYAQSFSLKERPSISDANIFREFFYTLVDKTSRDDVKAIARALARSTYLPRPIAMYLAMESIEVASPLLLFSPVLNDSDLIAISNNQSFEHAEIIERRDNKSERLTAHLKSLRNSGDNELLNREDAIKPQSGIKLPERVVQPVNSIKKQQPALIKVTREHQKDLSQNLVELANKGGRIRQEKRPSIVAVRPDQFEAKLLNQLKNGMREAYVENLATLTGLEAELIHDWLDTDNIGKLASLYRALELQPIISVRLLLMASQNLGRNSNVFSEVMAKFKKLNIAECKQQLAEIGASLFAKPAVSEKDVKAPHFAKLVADRRRSIRFENNTFSDKTQSDKSTRKIS